ncbi:GGDEF and EAL domain-containing protein [Clostridium aminobutyricum]|nr:GGDEF and EAL domain-containing protein [Clostridium aminobutyricum]
MTFSIVFLFVCFFYFFFGTYILYINPKEKINRIFFITCLSLFIWSFGFSIAISAPTMENCLFWRRISAIGWGTFFYELLIYIAILTGEEQFLKKRWVFLTLPPLFILYFFSLSSNAFRQYHFIYSSFGWVNFAPNNFYDLFFHVYVVGYVCLGLFLLWNWKKHETDKTSKNQANIIFYSFVTAFIIALFTDIIGNTVLPFTIPQIAPIIILLPCIGIFYSIIKYRFMNEKVYLDDEFILNEANRVRIYRHLSTAFIAGSFLCFIAQYIVSEHGNLSKILMSSAVLLLLGIAVKVLQYVNLEENIKNIIITISMVVAIPAITIQFVEFGGVTIWVFPFIFVIISLLLNKSNTLVFIAISAITTQILVWYIKPQAMVLIDSSDYIARIGILAIGIWVAFFVNKIYILRLKENVEQVRFQTLISDISANFVTINVLNFDEKINYALRKCGEHFEVEIASLGIFDMENMKIKATHRWYQSSKIERRKFEEMYVDPDTWWVKQLLLKEIVNISKNTDQLGHVCKETFFTTRLIPIVGNNQVLGFLEFNLAKSQEQWRKDQTSLLKIISNVFADALLKVNAEKEISYLAYYDQLTNLPNRVLFKDRANQAIHLANRTEKMLGIVFLDLDSFKTINDAIGHDGGDELLKQMAGHLSAGLRKSDTICRFGGDEFLILLTNISNREDIITVVNKVMELFNQVFILKEQEFFISASAGISIYPEDGADTDSLIKNANIALHKAKDTGKNQYLLCSSEMKEEIHTRIRLTNNLYHAKEREELYLEYQPQVCLETNQITGFEALLRWNHPEQGVISPNVFIPLAEHTGAINSIGEWALETACIQNKYWQNLGFPPVRMAVNLSVNQFRDPNLVSQVDNILKKTGLDPQYLELEITESITIAEEYYIVDVLNQLKKLGVSISIDDFGTEYSSLSRLKILPIDRIKIDMQFINGIENNDKDRVITDSIINLAKNLGLRVIAEGVENKAQLEFLRQRKCNEVQGFYLYRPISPSEVENIFRKISNN